VITLMSLAALVMDNDRWDAGWDLLRVAEPGDGNDTAAGYNLVQANRRALATCEQAAARAGKDQGCNIIVRAR
jgi:hypothetical protein